MKTPLANVLAQACLFLRTTKEVQSPCTVASVHSVVSCGADENRSNSFCFVEEMIDPEADG